MRIEVNEKIMDISDEEREHLELMGIAPKNKKFKWRRVWMESTPIFAVKEVTANETIIEFTDGEKMVVRGSYDDIKEMVFKAEEFEDSLEETD
jgi:uncharacterized protein YlzI (FlbEa/FlbD family)